ncbi:hypothetical protein R6Q59_034759 [Mikania micrantha]
MPILITIFHFIFQSKMNNKSNPSTTEEEFAIVSALTHVIAAGNEAGPSGCVIVEPPPEQETCSGCGMKVPDDCLGCDMYTKGEEEERKDKKYRGVSLRAAGNWGAEIMIPGKERIWLGTFNTAEEAARAYDRANILHRGKTAKTNFPMDDYGIEIEPDQPEENIGEGSRNADACDNVSEKNS